MQKVRRLRGREKRLNPRRGEGSNERGKFFFFSTLQPDCSATRVSYPVCVLGREEEGRGFRGSFSFSLLLLRQPRSTRRASAKSEVGIVRVKQSLSLFLPPVQSQEQLALSDVLSPLLAAYALTLPFSISWVFSVRKTNLAEAERVRACEM